MAGLKQSQMVVSYSHKLYGVIVLAYLAILSAIYAYFIMKMYNQHSSKDENKIIVSNLFWMIIMKIRVGLKFANYFIPKSYLCPFDGSQLFHLPFNEVVGELGYIPFLDMFLSLLRLLWAPVWSEFTSKWDKNYHGDGSR